MTKGSLFRCRCAAIGAAILAVLPVGVVQPGAWAADGKAAPPAKQPAEPPEVKMGREAHEEMLRSGLKLVTDPVAVQRVETIGKKIAAIANVTKLPAGYGSSDLVPFDYKFFIVDDPDINAFSLPGGYIYINKGLLNYCQSDDELAGVLGHEIMHAAHHHVMRLQKEQSRLNNTMLLGALVTLLARVPTTDALNVLQGFQLIALQKVNGFGQNAERDADHNGLIVSSKAGYNPVGMLTFMERLARDQKLRPDVELGIFRTHPPEPERVEAITAQLKEMNVPINRRSVTNMLKVEVRTVALKGNVQASEVLLDKKVLFRTPSAERAKTAASSLDRLLNEDVQLYDITRRGTTILVRGEPVFTVSPQDTDLPGSPSPDVVADTIFKNLRFTLYSDGIENGY